MLFFVLVTLPAIVVSHALVLGDLVPEVRHVDVVHDSEIITFNSDFFEENDLKRYLVFGVDSGNTCPVQKSILHGVQSGNGFFSMCLLSEGSAASLVSRGYNVVKDFKLDFHSEAEIVPDVSRIGEITGSTTAKSRFNSTGNGTVIAVVDTGVDFSNPDIRNSLARDHTNHPIMIDPDGQGIVLTNATFFAHIDENQIIRNYSRPLPDHMTSSVYVAKDGVFLDVSQGGRGSEIPIYNSFFPHLGGAAVFNGTLTNDMKIGENNRDYIKSKSGEYRLGVVYQGATQGPLARVQVVPVLVVDSFVPGVYDTIIPDLSTSWQDYTRFDLEPDEKAEYDFDFTDEKPIVLGNEKEFLVYDSDGDGRDDYSAGTVGARVLDVYGAVKKTLLRLSKG